MICIGEYGTGRPLPVFGIHGCGLACALLSVTDCDSYQCEKGVPSERRDGAAEGTPIWNRLKVRRFVRHQLQAMRYTPITTRFRPSDHAL